jgi:hypothetical protein
MWPTALTTGHDAAHSPAASVVLAQRLGDGIGPDRAAQHATVRGYRAKERQYPGLNDDPDFPSLVGEARTCRADLCHR